MSSETLRKIVLVDDHPVLRESIAAYVLDHCRDRLAVVAEAGDGVRAIEEVKKHQPDLVLIDVGMPRMDGITALREIRAASPRTRILVFSMFEDQSHVVGAIRAGADDYFFKNDATAGQMVGNILRALGLPPAKAATNKLLRDVKGGDEPTARLTGMEIEVLKLTAHRGLGPAEIAQLLDGGNGQISETDIGRHLNHLTEKLGARNPVHAAALAIKRGIITADDAAPKTPSDP